jgi:hypothetical protein
MSIVKILFVESPGGTRRHERPARSCSDHVQNHVKYAHGVRMWILKHSVREELTAKLRFKSCKDHTCLGVKVLSIKFNPLSPELNPICYLLALLAHGFLHVSRIRVKSLTLRFLTSYIYGAPILDVSRSHTTTQHSR